MNTRLSSLLLALALALAGCVDKFVPVEFYGLCGFDTSAACKAPAGKCGVYQNGQLYLYYENQTSLDMVAEYHNQRPNNADSVPGGVNTANAQITEYRYKFTGNPPVALSPQRVSYATTPIGAGGTSTLWMPIVPFETVLELRAIAGGYDGMLNVEITPRGHYGDGSVFEAASLTFPAWMFSGLPAPSTCANPAQTPTFCPSEFQTHTTICGAGTSTGSFIISGTVNNLTTSGLVLANPGSPDLVVNPGDTSFVFIGGFADGDTYNVTVLTQPTGQTCTVSNGTGTISGTDPVGISVTCAP